MLAFTRLYTLFFFAFGILLVGSAAKISPKHKALSALEARGLHTNAARMEAGLPPLRPRQLFSPTRVARSPKPSGQPVEVCNNRIKVTQGTGSSSNVIGYVAATQTKGAFKVDKSGRSNNHLKVKFTPSSNTFNILIESSGAGSKPYLGFGGSNTNLNVANAYNVLTGTGAVAAGSAPLSNANTLASTYARSYSESAIWSYSGSSLSASWVNPGKLTVSTDFYITKDDELIQVATGISGPAQSTKVYLSAEN